MRKILLSFLRYLAFISLFTDLSALIKAQVPVLGPETFGTGMALPTGWVATIPATKNGWEMISTVYPSSGYTQPNASGGSHIKVDATAATDAYLYSPFIDCSNYTNGVLKFGIWRAPGNDRTLIISVELNGDLDFKKYRYFVYTDATPEREKWFLHTIDLKNLIDHKQKVRIRFGLSATINYAGPIRIDDIVLYARPAILPTDHFRTRSSGNWDDPLCWESSHDSISWIPSQLTPTYQSSSITIRNAHNITNTSPQTVDQLTIKEGGTLILAHDLSLVNGLGNDLMVDEGSILDLSTYHITGTGNVSLNGYLKTARPEGVFGHDSSSLAPSLELAPVGVNSIIEYNAKGSQYLSPGLGYAHLITSGTGDKQLTGPTLVSKTLQVSGGHLLLNDYDLAVGVMATGSPSSYIKINGTGKLTISNIGTEPRKFPIGNASYNPVTVSSGTGLNWTVGIEDKHVSSDPAMAANKDKSVHRTWSISPSLNPPPLAADVLLEYNDNDQEQVGTAYKRDLPVQVWRQAEQGWLGAGGTQNPINTPDGTRIASFSSDAFFSLFTISNITAPLPIRFRDVSARLEQSIVLISFTNTAESGVEDYILERSGDGMSYKYLQAVHPARNDGTSVGYEIKDASPLTGLNLYRIKGREKDGRITYSPVIRLHTKSSETRLNIVPNPAHKGEISVQLTNVPGDNYKLSLYNAEGQLLLQQCLQHAGGSATIPLKINHLQPGTYLIECSGKEKLLQRFVIL